MTTQPPNPVAAGLAGRCPACGQGPMFGGYLQVVDKCESCGAELSRCDAGDGAAVFVILILGAVVVPLALLVEAKFEPPLWVHAVLWGTAILGGALGLMRPLKGVFVALQYAKGTPDQ